MRLEYVQNVSCSFPVYFMQIKSTVLMWHNQNFHGILKRHQMETFSRYRPFVRGIHRSPVDSSHKGTVMRTFVVYVVSLIKLQTNTELTGNSRRHDGHSRETEKKRVFCSRDASAAIHCIIHVHVRYIQVQIEKKGKEIKVVRSYFS